MNVKFRSTNKITTTVEFTVEQLNLTNDELFALLDRALGHTITHENHEGRTMDDDYTLHSERYGDKADKELLRLIKIRLEKPVNELQPVCKSWTT